MAKFAADGVLERVVDGDTLRCRLDLGWRVSVAAIVRLADCDAPELRTAAGATAKARLSKWLPVGCPVRVSSYAIDRYGRTIATVTRAADGLDVGAELVREGLAAPL